MTSKRTALFVLKAIVGILLLCFIVYRLGPSEVASELRNPIWSYLWLAVLAQIAAKLVWTLRWQAILGACGMHRGFWELLILVHIGLFFNNFLPSSIGGDAVRGFYASSGKGDIIQSYGALLVERIVGMMSLAAICAFAALFELTFSQSSLSPALLVIVLAASIAICLIGALLLWWSDRAAHAHGAFAKQPKVASLVRGLTAGWMLLKTAHDKRRVVIASSLALQLIAIFFYFFCARAMGITTPVVSFLVIVPIAVVISMIPVSLNGLGVREGAFIGLLQQQGVPAATGAAFSLLALVLGTVFSLAGGILYAVWSPGRRRGQRETSNSGDGIGATARLGGPE